MTDASDDFVDVAERELDKIDSFLNGEFESIIEKQSLLSKRDVFGRSSFDKSKLFCKILTLTLHILFLIILCFFCLFCSILLVFEQHVFHFHLCRY